MLGDISPQTVRITQQAVVYPGRDHVTSLRVERFDGRTYKPVDMTAVTRVILSFPEADPVIVYDSSVQAVFTHVGTTLTVDLSDYAMPASAINCQIILFDAEHASGQVLVDDEDTQVQFDFRNVSATGGTPPPGVEYLTDAPVDGETYGRKDAAWVPLAALVSGVASVNGQSGVVVLDAADVGADAAGTGASQAASAVAAHVALSDPHPQYLTPSAGNAAYDAIGAAASAVGTHVAASDPHPQYLTPAEGDAAYDALGAAASAVSTHIAASDPHPQYNTQSEGDARYERGLTAGTNITIDRTNPAAPVISASGGGGGGAVDSVNGQTGVVVLDAADVGADAAGTAAAAVSAHVAATNPHPEYLTPAEGDAAYTPIAHVGAGGAAHANAVAAGAAGFMTGADKTKLDGVEAGAQVNAPTDLSVGYSSGYVTLNSSTGADTALDAATAVVAGVMTAADKAKLNGVATGATALPAVQTFTGAKTLGLADVNTYNVSQDATAQAVTLPAQASVAWTADAEINIEWGAAGAVTITGAAGVTINGVVAPSILLFAKGAVATLKRKGLNDWTLVGAIGSAAEQRAALGLGSISGVNRIINGAFNINQRAVSGTVTLAAGAYGHDRWKAGASGCTYTFATSSNVTTITITAGSLQQVIEGINLQSGTHTLSWSGTAQGKIGAGSYGASGITGAAVGGTNLTVEFNTGTLSFAQLQPGSFALPFDHRHYGQELILCELYTRRIVRSAYQMYLNGQAVSANQVTGAIFLGSPMRASPSVSVSPAVTSLMVTNAANVGTAVTAGTISGAAADLLSFSLTVASGLVAGDASQVISGASETRLLLSAEI